MFPGVCREYGFYTLDRSRERHGHNGNDSSRGCAARAN